MFAGSQSSCCDRSREFIDRELPSIWKGRREDDGNRRRPRVYYGLPLQRRLASLPSERATESLAKDERVGIASAKISPGGKRPGHADGCDWPAKNSSHANIGKIIVRAYLSGARTQNIRPCDFRSWDFLSGVHHMSQACNNSSPLRASARFVPAPYP